MPTSRILTAGRRPYIVFTIMLVPFILLGLSLGFTSGKWVEAAKAAGSMLFLYAAVCLYLSRLRLEVTPDTLVYRAGFTTRTIHLTDIRYSTVEVLAEPDHPVSVSVYGVRPSPASPRAPGSTRLLEIRLKVFPQPDVQWLLSLPALKARRPS